MNWCVLTHPFLGPGNTYEISQEQIETDDEAVYEVAETFFHQNKDSEDSDNDYLNVGADEQESDNDYEDEDEEIYTNCVEYRGKQCIT